MKSATFAPVADHALLVIFGAEIDDETHASVVALDTALQANPPAGVCELVPAFVNLLIVFDPLITDHKVLEDTVQGMVAGLSAAVTVGSRKEVEICYDPDFGQDLDLVSGSAGMSVDAVIKSHLAGRYCVRMYGFAPGYAYMDGTPGEIQVPRKQEPVRDIPAGSVLIAGPQCLVTTLIMPTGWSIIGRSPTPIFQDNAERPFLFDIGDQVQFRRIGRDDYERQIAGNAPP